MGPCFIIVLIIEPRKIFKPQLKQGGGYLGSHRPQDSIALSKSVLTQEARLNQ
jgi:hypothetical protein